MPRLLPRQKAAPETVWGDEVPLWPDGLVVHGVQQGAAQAAANRARLARLRAAEVPSDTRGVNPARELAHANKALQLQRIAERAHLRRSALAPTRCACALCAATFSPTPKEGTPCTLPTP